MKADILNLEGKKIKSIDLPIQFNEEYRPDLIRRAVLTIQSNKRQPYGVMPGAGMRYSAKLSRRRRDYKGAYGHGISRAPRKTLWHRGTQFGWVGALAPGTVGGRKAHPPKAEKIWKQKINKKERRKAIRSAITATALNDIVGKKFNVPIIIESSFENLKKAKEVETVLIKLGLQLELDRAKEVKIRAGKGKIRGRKYRAKKGPLIVVSKDCHLIKAANNFEGIDIVEVNKLNTEILAPGMKPGRLTIWTDKSIEVLKNNNLFLDKVAK